MLKKIMKSMRHVTSISERKIVRKMYGSIKEKECWRIRTNKVINDKGKTQ